MCAGGVEVARPEDRRAGGGASPTPALRLLRVVPIPIRAAKAVIVPNTDYSPAVALDVGLSHSRHTFDKLAPASAGVSANISQALTPM